MGSMVGWQRRRRLGLLWMAAVWAGAAHAQPVQPQEPAPAKGLTGTELTREAIAISKLLRDPASANYTLFDSESAIAGELKARIYEMLRQGRSREEIFDFMVARYGEMIRYEPDFNAKTALLWVAPWAVLACGAAAVWLRVRGRRKAARGARGGQPR